MAKADTSFLCSTQVIRNELISTKQCKKKVHDSKWSNEATTERSASKKDKKKRKKGQETKNEGAPRSVDLAISTL